MSCCHGWAVNSLMTFHGGQPLDQVRPGLNVTGDSFAGVNHSFQRTATFTGVHWLNPNVFCSPSATCLPNILGGNLRRNQYYGPGFADIDLSVFKNISITERVKAQLRAEMFNLTNHINLASGVGATSPTGGDITDTIGDFNGAPGIGPGEAFNMVLGLKILF